MAPIPQVLTHNYDPERGPFRNICKLPPPEAESVLDEIRAAGHRRIKADYLERRLAVEDWLIRESRRKLGSARLGRPIYFFLGDFADGRDPSRPDSFVLPLAAFPWERATSTRGRESPTTAGSSPCRKSRTWSQSSACPATAGRRNPRCDTTSSSRFKCGTIGPSSASSTATEN